MSDEIRDLTRLMTERDLESVRAAIGESGLERLRAWHDSWNCSEGEYCCVEVILGTGTW